MDYRTLKDAIPWDILVKEGLRLVETARQAKSERSEEQARAGPAGAAAVGGSRRAARGRAGLAVWLAGGALAAAVGVLIALLAVI